MTRRYSAVACFDAQLEHVVLIHKLKPAWQAGKANFPGGKVEEEDRIEAVRKYCIAWSHLELDGAHKHCAVRELTEETGLVVDAADLKLFCILKYRSREGNDAECRFYCCVGNVEAAKTMESERVFVQYIDNFFFAGQAYGFHEEIVDDINDPEHGRRRNAWLPTMPNISWLTAMARQALRDSLGAPYTVCEEVIQ